MKKLRLFIFMLLSVTVLTALFAVACKTKEYDLTKIIFEDANYTYDGTERTLEVTGDIPDGVSVKYITPNCLTNAGTIEVKVGFYETEKPFSLIEERTATLTIEKATYDMTGISFTDTVFTYDGTEKSIVISGNLPLGVTVTYENNALTSTGSIIATAKFSGDFDNYNPIPDKTATLTVAARIPQIDVTAKAITHSSVEFGTTISDPDSLVTSVGYVFNGISVPNGGALIFEHLLSDYEYTLEYNYEYDTGDGTGTQQVHRSVILTTAAAPTAPEGHAITISDSGIVFKDYSENGYCGWPTCTTGGGYIFVAFSGNRTQHVGDKGKIYFSKSPDYKLDFTTKEVYSSDLDERDCGILYLNDGRLMLNVLRLDTQTRIYSCGYMFSSDLGETWSEMYTLDLYSPHGPIQLKNGDLLWFGKSNIGFDEEIVSRISKDGGKTWINGTGISMPEFATIHEVFEPTCVELEDGTIMGAFRYSGNNTHYAYGTSFFYTYSHDGGMTWDAPVYSGIDGTPPHLQLHSSGTIVCTYGKRTYPYGVRVMLSDDDGQTFYANELLLAQYSWDFGYPSSIELNDGSILTVCYGLANPTDSKTSILFVRWNL